MSETTPAVPEAPPAPTKIHVAVKPATAALFLDAMKAARAAEQEAARRHVKLGDMLRPLCTEHGVEGECGLEVSLDPPEVVLVVKATPKKEGP
jgi:hypothetical protein